MRRKEKPQDYLFSIALYESRIPADHFLRRLKALLDWHAFAGELDDCYRHKGRASVPPEVMLKIMILQYVYDLSDRQFEEQLRYRIDFLWFLGLSLDEAGSDHSTLSRFRARVGNERFARIFNAIVPAARRAGLIADRLHAIDTQAVSANVATWCRRDRDRDDDADPPGFVRFEGSPPGSPDPDAAWGAKSDKKFFLGFKHHLSVEVDSGMIVAIVVTPGNEHDVVAMASELDDAAGTVVADKAYDLPRNHQLLKVKRIDNRIVSKRGGGDNTGRYLVEQVNAVVWWRQSTLLGTREGEHTDDARQHRR